MSTTFNSLYSFVLKIVTNIEIHHLMGIVFKIFNIPNLTIGTS
jgi:hypothetical protein